MRDMIRRLGADRKSKEKAAEHSAARAGALPPAPSLVVRSSSLLAVTNPGFYTPAPVPREVLEWPYTAGGGGVPWTPLPPPDQSDHSGKNETYHQENLVGPFLIHNLLGPRPPLPPCQPPAPHSRFTPSHSELDDDEEEPDDTDFTRESGFVDFGRILLEVDPGLEWGQIFADTWRHLRDEWWDVEFGGVDWQQCHDRYAALVPRVATRLELTDLLCEMIGELGCSHSWHSGGDVPPLPSRCPGKLGCEWEWDAAAQGYRITHIVQGDLWSAKQGGPLAAPGLGMPQRPGLERGTWIRLLEAAGAGALERGTKEECICEG